MEERGLVMKILVGTEEIPLDDSDVTVANKLVGMIFRSAEKASRKRPTFYFTLAIVLYIKALDIIGNMGPEKIALFMEIAKNPRESIKN
jgi:hypothetical protein